MTDTTRRAFFLSGSAVLGAGVATAVGAKARMPGTPREPDAAGADARESVLALCRASLANQRFMERIRQDPTQQNDVLTFSPDGERAVASLSVEVEVCTPIEGDFTIAQMARLQGNVASRHWEQGRFEARCVKRNGQWQVDSLTYHTFTDRPAPSPNNP